MSGADNKVMPIIGGLRYTCTISELRLGCTKFHKHLCGTPVHIGVSQEVSMTNVKIVEA